MAAPKLHAKDDPELILTPRLVPGRVVSTLWFGRLVFRSHEPKSVSGAVVALKSAIGFQRPGTLADMI